MTDCLACPACGSAVGRSPEGIVCDSGHRYQVIDDVPKFVAPALGSGSTEPGQVRLIPRGTRRSRLRRLHLVPSAVLVRNAALKAIASSSGRVLDVGSGERRLSTTTVNLDIESHGHVDVIADAHRLPFVDRSFDLVVCQEVLEHVVDPPTVVAEIRRVLRDGGLAFVQAPFLEPFHGDPDDFQRYTLSGLRRLMAAFEIVESGVSAGLFSAAAFGVRELPEVFLANSPWIVRAATKIPFALFGVVLRYGDLLIARAPHGHRLAAELYVIGRRREA